MTLSFPSFCAALTKASMPPHALRSEHLEKFVYAFEGVAIVTGSTATAIAATTPEIILLRI